MPNPIHLLRRGIELRNWPLVCEAYADLAGEAAPQPSSDSLVVEALTGTPQEFKGSKVEYPLPAETEPCCDCGEAYPRSELLAGEMLCAACRAKANRLDGGEPGPLPEETASLFDEMLTPSEPEVAKTEPKAPHRVSVDDFRVKPVEASRKRSGGGTYTRPVDVTPAKNSFRDNLAVATRELKQDRLLVERGVRSSQPLVEPRRPPGVVTVTCRSCSQPKQILATEAPARRLANDDEGGSTYVCDECIGKKAKSRR